MNEQHIDLLAALAVITLTSLVIGAVVWVIFSIPNVYKRSKRQVRKT